MTSKRVRAERCAWRRGHSVVELRAKWCTYNNRAATKSTFINIRLKYNPSYFFPRKPRLFVGHLVMGSTPSYGAFRIPLKSHTVWIPQKPVCGLVSIEQNNSKSTTNIMLRIALYTTFLALRPTRGPSQRRILRAPEGGLPLKNDQK